MKMTLFRPTFVTAGMIIFQLVALLCTLTTPVSAVPQFGRPLMHVLDESPVDSITTGLVNNGVSAAAPTVANEQVNAANATTTSSIAATPSVVQSSTSDASHHLGGVHPGILFGAAAASSAIFLVF